MAQYLSHFVQTYPGSSFPTRVQTTADEYFVVKLRGSGNGSAAQISEFVVNRLAAQAGLAVPGVCIVEIPDDHPWDYGTDEFYDLVQKSGGPNLAIQPIAGPRPITGQELGSLPEAFISQVVTLDLAFSNLDRSQRSGNLLIDADGKPWMVDHGTCRFAFAPPAGSSRTLPVDHVFARLEKLFEPRWIEQLATDALLSTTVAEVPQTWLADVPYDRSELHQRIRSYLHSADPLGG